MLTSRLFTKRGVKLRMPKTNLASGREVDLNLEPREYKSTSMMKAGDMYIWHVRCQWLNLLQLE